MSRITVAAVQMRSTMDPARNLRDFAALVREAAGKGARYIQSPEMTGALVRDRKLLMQLIKPAESDPLVARAAELAAELGVHLHIGSTAIARPDGKVANRAFVFGPDGGLIATYDKIHMFDVDLDNGESWRESATYEPGREAVVANLPFGRMGLAVCYDLRFPQLFREEALAGATRNAAAALGLDDCGTIAEGMRADLAVWDIKAPAELSYRIGFNPLHSRIFGGNS